MALGTCTTFENDLAALQVAEGLAQLVRHAVPSARDLAFTGLSRSAGGLSRENWSLDASWSDAGVTHAHRLMLMRDASGTLLKTERRREFDVLKALEGSAVAAPAVFWMDPDGRFLGAPSLVMERVAGICDYMVLNCARPLEERLELARAFLHLLVDIQATDWHGRGLGPSLGVPDRSPAQIALDQWEAEYRRVQLEPHPELDYVLVWMRRTAPQPAAVVLHDPDLRLQHGLARVIVMRAPEHDGTPILRGLQSNCREQGEDRQLVSPPCICALSSHSAPLPAPVYRTA